MRAVLALLLASALAQADERGDAVIARARACEKAQLAALAGTSRPMHTVGTLRDGRTTHALEAMRRLGVTRDGSITNDFVWGKLDGAATDEAGLRKASGAPKKPRGQAESLTVAMTPFTSRDCTLHALGPVAGGYGVRCDVRIDAAVGRIDFVVDEASGRKLSARLFPAGTLVKLAERADMELAYAPDGTPAALRSQFVARFLWIDRAADLLTTPAR